MAGLHPHHPPGSLCPQSVTHENKLDYSLTFSGNNVKVVSDDFQGGRVSALFVGSNIDLRNAKIKNNQLVTLDVSAVFGGVKVIVPKSWEVESSLTGVFGGFSNNTSFPGKSEGKLVIKGSSVFGGAEITN